jgi:SAM-dependent methyltransferase
VSAQQPFESRTVEHPAKFTDILLYEMGRYIESWMRVLDPFAGTGRIHKLNAETVGVEIEPEWANLHPQTIVGDACALPFQEESFDAVATSPCYGNRMADHHNAKDASKRITYRHVLGRELHPNSAGKLQWGEKYRAFHRRAWKEAVRVLRPGGRFVLNVSDHIRAGEGQPVTDWHVEALKGAGLQALDFRLIETPRMRRGANGDKRLPYESLIVFAKPFPHAEVLASPKDVDEREAS